MESRVERGPTLPLPVDLYSWQVMDLMLYGTGMYRISQAASRPLAEILSEIRSNDFHNS